MLEPQAFPPAPLDAVAPVSRVDPELVPALSAIPDFDTLCLDNLAEFRTIMGEATPVAGSPLLDVQWIEVAPGIGALLYVPARLGSDRRPCAMLNIHGGGFVMGTAAREDALMRELCIRHSMVILSVDYRLAPEAPYPAPLDDCLAGFDWLAAQSGPLGIAQGRIGIRGVSAGGGLAAGLALRLRDRGTHVPAWLWLLYPMLDDRTSGAPGAGSFVWTPAANAFGWASYLGSEPGGEDVAPYAAPARAQNLAGLPPTFLATGSIDLFAAEDVEFARRLLEAGTPIELHVYPGAYHGFNLVATASVAERYRLDADRAVGRFTANSIP
jgi:acetyl esterase/lipase